MATKHVIGLVNVEMGAIAGDGGMGTSLAPVGETVSDSAALNSEDNTITDFNIEESDSPVESIVTARGAVRLAWSTYDVQPDTLVKFFGGTKITGPPLKWQAPDAFPSLEQSLKITDKKGNILEIPRAAITGKFGLSFNKGKLGQIDLIAVVLQPTKAGEKRMTLTTP